MSLHADWSKAKSDGEKNFAAAYKNWITDLQKKAPGDDKAKAVLIKQQLSKSGLDKGYKFADYMTFGADFGPSLDKLEKLAASNKNAIDKAVALKAKDLAADPKLAKLFVSLTHSDGEMEFYATGYKLDPQKAYDTYIKSGASKEINITHQGKAAEALKKASGTPAMKKDGPAHLLKIRGEMEALIDGQLTMSIAGNRSSKMSQAFFQHFGQADTSALKQKCLDTALAYNQQITAYRKRWQAFQPDFAAPMLKSLNDIVAAVQKM